jgi:hybrid cluster-associated redox disulfide protein
MAMPSDSLDDLSVAEIMRHWPATIRVFLDRNMKCVGCPIAPFHTLVDAAAEHHLPLPELQAAVERQRGPASRAGPA